jgi:hypothetical protein
MSPSSGGICSGGPNRKELVSLYLDTSNNTNRVHKANTMQKTEQWIKSRIAIGISILSLLLDLGLTSDLFTSLSAFPCVLHDQCNTR